jgi:CBS domain-containing protein
LPALPVGFALPYNITVADVMSTPAIVVGANAPLLDAVVLMRTHRVSGLPVVDVPRRVAGVISQKDLSRVLVGRSAFPEISGLLDILLAGITDPTEAMLRHLRETLREVHVRAAMSSPALVIRPDAPLELAAEVLRENSINRLPVVDRGLLLGVVTRHDLIRGMVGVTPHRSPVGAEGRPVAP